MPLAAGTRLGPYEILAPLGAGGMGEVYRARDTKLKRDVALKVLPEAFSSDPARMARFQREAEVLASLNHPNIAHLYGIEERALVMELVEGVTLPCPIPIETAINYAKQIAEALEYAHEKGVVHRDLKPANIKITPEGVVKALDFGLAKAIDDPVPSADPSNSPTLTMGATRVGMILGTAAYMSPEQASGYPADRRADIWSFGAVLYEMLAGKKAFAGESVSDTLATVLKLDPDWDALPFGTPAFVRLLVQRCLTKDRKQRLQAIGEARIALENPVGPAALPPATAPLQSRLGWVFAAAAVLFGVALAAVSFLHFREVPPLLPTGRFDLALPEQSGPQYFSVSPNGRDLAFTSDEGGTVRLWVRPLDSLESRPLAGTDGASLPFWSPDSANLGFFADGKLKKIAVAGGPAQKLCDAPNPRGGTWNRDGVIVFAPNVTGGLYHVPADEGGSATLLTNLAASGSQEVQIFPEFILGSKRFLYVQNSGPAGGIYAASLDGAPGTHPSGSIPRCLCSSRRGEPHRSSLAPARDHTDGPAVRSG